MFHPLMKDMESLKDLEIESKINDLSQKYSIAARHGNGALCNQIILVLESYKAELQKRLIEKNNRVSVNNQEKDLDNLININ